MTVGYGDIVPQNPREVAFALFTVLGGCLVFGYNLNKIATIFQDMNKDKKKVQENILKINKFMESKRINSNLQMRIRAYLKFIWESHNEKLNNEIFNIINSLSESLKQELYLEGYGKIIRNHPLLSSDNFSENFLGTLIKSIEEETFMKNDMIFEENDDRNLNIYFITTGEIELVNIIDEKKTVILQKLKDKQSFGEYSFITGFQHSYSAKACEFTKVYKISHKKFLETLTSFPKDYEKYCEIKDKIILYHDFNNCNIRCHICLRKDHLNDNCALAHFIPNKTITILKHEFSHDQTRKACFRKNKKANSLLIKKKIIKSLPKLEKSMESDEVISENTSDVMGSYESLEKVGSNNEMEEKEKDKEKEKEKETNKNNIENYNSNSITKLLKEPVPPVTIVESKTTVVLPDKGHQTIVKLCEPDIDLGKAFEFYFNENNVENFIEKYKKIRKDGIKEKKKKKGVRGAILKNEKKQGYGLFRSFSDEKISNNNLPAGKKSIKTGNEKMSGFARKTQEGFKGFFALKTLQKPLNFLDLVTEAKSKKMKVKSKSKKTTK